MRHGRPAARTGSTQNELTGRLSAAPADLADIHPNIADTYRHKVAQLAEALDHPGDRDAAASAISGLIERIVLTPGPKWAEMDTCSTATSTLSSSGSDTGAELQGPTSPCGKCRPQWLRG